jgi:hypothetical protein
MNEQIKQDCRELFEKIKDYDLNKIIERHKKDDAVGLEVATERVNELKKWMVLAKTNPKNSYQLTGNIDKIWHTFLTFTRDYQDFCNELGAFVHHEPADTVKIREAFSNPSALNEMNEKFNRDYSTLLSDYKEVFDTPPPITVWSDISNPYGRTEDPGAGCSTNTCGCGNSQVGN